MPRVLRALPLFVLPDTGTAPGVNCQNFTGMNHEEVIFSFFLFTKVTFPLIHWLNFSSCDPKIIPSTETAKQQQQQPSLV